MSALLCALDWHAWRGVLVRCEPDGDGGRVLTSTRQCARCGRIDQRVRRARTRRRR